MSTPYTSGYTGAEIDAAIGVVDDRALNGLKDVRTNVIADTTPATVTLDYANGNAYTINRVTNNPAAMTIAIDNWNASTNYSYVLVLYLDCGTETSLTLPNGFNSITLTASKMNKILLESFYNTRTSAWVNRATLIEAW